MLAIAPKVFREALDSQVKIDNGTGLPMEFKLSDADLWVRRLTEDTQIALRSAVENSVRDALSATSPYLFPYVTLKNLAHGQAAEALKAKKAPTQDKALSDLTIGEVVDTYNVHVAVDLAAWLQMAKSGMAKLEALDQILGTPQEESKPETQPETAKSHGSGLKEQPVSRDEGRAGPKKKAAKARKPVAERQEPPVQASLGLEPAQPVVAGLPGSTKLEAEKPGRVKKEHKRETPNLAQSPAESHKEPPVILEHKSEEGSTQAFETASVPAVTESRASTDSLEVKRRRPRDLVGSRRSAIAKLVSESEVLSKQDFLTRLEAEGLQLSPNDLVEHELPDEPDQELASDWVLVSISGMELICEPTLGLDLKRIHDLCLKHIETTGAASVDVAASKAVENPDRAAKLKSRLVEQLIKVDGFTWLDQDSGWFCIKRHKSRVIKTILKIMSACRKLPLDELMTGVYRSKTGLGPPISKDIFRKLCRHTAGLQVYKDDVVAAKRGWCKQDKLLSEVDQKLVRMFAGRRKIMSYQSLVQFFTDRGLTTQTALAAPELHPLLKKVAPMLYTLRGLQVEVNPW